MKAAKSYRSKSSDLEATDLVDAVVRVLSFCIFSRMLFDDRAWDKPRIDYMLFSEYSCHLPASLSNFELSAGREMASSSH